MPSYLRMLLENGESIKTISDVLNPFGILSLNETRHSDPIPESLYEEDYVPTHEDFKPVERDVR